MNKSASMGPRPTKACVNCRRLKMKCELSGPPPCRRCRHTRANCVFKPRANASIVHELVDLQDHALNPLPIIPGHQSILDRLARIEASLGIVEDAEADELPVDIHVESSINQSPMQEVYRATARLRLITRPTPDEVVWSRPVVEQLWSSFLENLPLLHFLTDRSAFASPTPLLLASVLYISALHHPSPDQASLISGYFAATCCAISELVTPALYHIPTHSAKWGEERNTSQQAKRENAFRNILGLIMASLSSEAYIDATGSWIAMAYRIWLDYCPADLSTTTQDWRGLFSGLQVIDIEHASMHMSYPLLPRHAPAPGIQRLDSQQGNAFQGLAEMMHFGLSHFVGRGLPTIWSSISADGTEIVSEPRSPFTPNDLQIIRHWARKLDDWLVLYNGASQPSPSDRQGILLLLQYHLHKLYVLSIYHPARGFDLSPANISAAERHELLVSARAALRLRRDDASIWSNWDLVMITWAAILLLQGVEDGMTHQDDLYLIQAHLQSLERHNQSVASIHTLLFQRLEANMQAMHTPPDTSSALGFPGPGVGDSWTIFDQEIMSLANPSWLFEGSTEFQQFQRPFAAPQLQNTLSSARDSTMPVSTLKHAASNAEWSSINSDQIPE